MTRRHEPHAKPAARCVRCNSTESGERNRHHIIPRNAKHLEALDAATMAATADEVGVLCWLCHREYHHYYDLPGATVDEHRERFALFLDTVPSRVLVYLAQTAPDEMTMGEVRQLWAGMREWWGGDSPPPRKDPWADPARRAKHSQDMKAAWARHRAAGLERATL